MFLSEENNASISVLLPIVHRLITALEVNDGDSASVNNLKERFLLLLHGDMSLMIYTLVKYDCWQVLLIQDFIT